MFLGNRTYVVSEKNNIFPRDELHCAECRKLIYKFFSWEIKYWCYARANGDVIDQT